MSKVLLLAKNTLLRVIAVLRLLMIVNFVFPTLFIVVGVISKSPTGVLILISYFLAPISVSNVIKSDPVLPLLTINIILHD